MSDDINEQIKNRICEIFPDEATASKIVNMVVTGKKPQGASRRSVWPYYNEKCGKQIRNEADAMIASGNPRICRYETWTGVSPTTLYNRINQSIRYLLDHLDPDGKYKKWNASIFIDRKSNSNGIMIRFIEGLSPTQNQEFIGEEIKPETMKSRWQIKLDDWLESDDVSPFVQEGLALNPQEIADVKASLCQVEDIQFFVSSSTIKVIKTR